MHPDGKNVEKPTPIKEEHLRVGILMRFDRDASLICDVLRRAGIQASICPTGSSPGLREALRFDCLLCAEELLDDETIESLKREIEQLPPWSELPLLLLTLGGEASSVTLRRRERRKPLGDLVLLERPTRPETLVSAVQSALRARARQYQIRDHIEQFKRAEEALRNAEKLAVAGRLASSIAHEINNPLEAVTNLLYLARTSESPEQSREFLETAERELARVSEITTTTLKFYRQGSRPAPVKIPEILDSALAVHHPRLVAAGIRVERRFEPAPPILGMSGELRQVFSNLVGNALDAMRSGGRLMVHVYASREYAKGLRPGVRVAIGDTGAGIPAEVRRRVLEPFVTTKGDTGTGLGLWISSEIIHKHGGHLSLKTRTGDPGRSGTVFSIFLPLEAKPAAEDSVPRAATVH
jgi:signal transduction histidine kinase